MGHGDHGRWIRGRLRRLAERHGALLLALGVACSSSGVILAAPAAAAGPALTITPVTWNVLGLDSNRPDTDGPDTFPIGARVCNTGDAPATSTAATFVFDSANPFITLVGPASFTLGTLQPGACLDAYFAVKITRNTSAFDTTRRYHIEATADGLGTISTPTPRELYVERLVSQNRNAVASITGSAITTPPSSGSPGQAVVYVGQTYTFTVNSSTATGGYEQLESFLHVPNTIFRVLSIEATYSMPTGATNDKFYADACGWDNVIGPRPSTGTYLSCIGPEQYVGGKAGGSSIVTTYTVEVVAPGSATMSTLIYDFSGSSFHYNADYQANINAVAVTSLPAPTADLRLTKTETASPTFVGDDAVFRLSVHNDGTSDAPGVEVTDLLPAGLTYRSADASQGTYDPVTGRWDVGSVADGATATLDITARVDEPTVENFAEVTAVGIGDPDSQPAEGPLGPGSPPNQDDEASTTVSVAPRADLSLTKERIAGPDGSGNTVYRIALTNAGPSPATGVEARDLPPVGATFVTADAEQGTFDDGTGIWNVGSIAPGTTVFVDVTYAISSFPATNYAEITAANEADPDSEPQEDALGPGNAPNQDDEESVTVTPSTDISVSKVETAGVDFVGQQAEYLVTITNDGPNAANEIELTDLLPAGLDYVTHTASTGTYDPDTGIWTVDAIASGAAATLTVTATVTTAGTIENTAELTESGAPDPDSAPGNADPSEDDQASASVTTTGATLAGVVFYDVDRDGSRGPVEPSLEAADVTVIGAGPNGTFGDGDDVVSPVTTTDASGTWTVSGLGPGPHRVTVDPTTLPPGISVPTYDLDGVSSPHEAELTLTLGQQRDDVDFGYTTPMTVDKTSSLAIDVDGDGKTGPGDTIQYVVSIDNAGSTPLTTVVVTDELPPTLEYVAGSTVVDDGLSVTPVDDDLAPPASTIYPFDEAGRDIPDVPASSTTEVRFRARLVAPFTSSDSSVRNRVTVTSDQGSDVSTDVRTLAEADLVLTKSEIASPTFVGQQAVFRLELHNDGPDLAPAVRVSDPMPTGLTFVGADPSQGSYDPGTGLWTVGDVADGATATLEITARVDATSVHNFAEVTMSGAVDPDSRPAEDPLGPADPPNEDDEDDVVVTVAPRADLSLTKARTSGPDELGATTFRLTLTNDGPSGATGVQVTELPPAGAAFVSATPSQGTFESTTGIWDVGAVSAGSPATLDVVYTIDSFPATNFAEVTAVNEADPSSEPAEDPLGPGEPPNQDDEAAVTVTPSADLSLTKVVTSAPQFVGDTAVFELTVENLGPDAARSIEVTDALPVGLRHLSHEATKGDFTPGTGVWAIGSIASGASQTLTIHARVTAPGTITNVAEVTASGAPDPDSVPANGDPGEDDWASSSIETSGASLGDSVFYDVDGDGERDSGEPGIPGVEIRVTDAGPNGTLGDGDDVALPIVITDASGAWSVVGLGPGPYRITVDPATLPAGLTDPTVDPDGISSAHTTELTLVAGAVRDDVDFGYAGTASVGDTVFLDNDGNGRADDGEGINDVRVDVTWSGFDGVFGNDDDVSYPATTNDSGTWNLDALPAGAFQVRIDLSTIPAGMSNSFDPDGGNDATSFVTLLPGINDNTQNFGFLGLGQIGQTIFRDDDGDGVPGPGEGLVEVSVRVVWAGPDGTFATDDDQVFLTITDAEGNYLVGNLAAGLMWVEVLTDSLPPETTNTVDPDGGNDSTSRLALEAGASDLDQNFGYVVPTEAVGSLPRTGSGLVGVLVPTGLSLLLLGGLLLLVRPGRHNPGPRAATRTTES